MNISSDSHNQPKSTAFLPVHFVRDARHPLFRAEEKAVFFAIAARMKTTTDTAFPGLKKIALDAGVGLSTATRVVTWALEIGVLVLVKDDEQSGRRSFIFDYERLANLPTNLPRRTAGKANVAAPSSANKKAFPGKGTAFPGNAPPIPRELTHIPRECTELDADEPVPGNAPPIPREEPDHSPGMTKDQEKDQSKEQEGGELSLVSTRATEEEDPWDLKGDAAPLTPRSPSFPASPSPKHVESAATKDKSAPAKKQLSLLGGQAPAKQEAAVKAPKVPKPASEPKAPKMTNAERFRGYAAAFRRGYSRGVGRDVSVDAIKGPDHIVVQALQAHAKGGAGERLTGDDVLAWLERKAEEFGRSVGVVPFIYSRFNDFLNGAKKEPWRRDTVPTPTQAPMVPSAQLTPALDIPVEDYIAKQKASKLRQLNLGRLQNTTATTQEIQVAK